MQLKLTTRTVEGILVVNCDGRIVFGEESAELRDTVKKLLSQTNRMVLNLGGVTYIDSGNLGRALHHRAQRGGSHQAFKPDAACGRFTAGDQAADRLRSLRYRRPGNPVLPKGRCRVIPRAEEDILGHLFANDLENCFSPRPALRRQRVCVAACCIGDRTRFRSPVSASISTGICSIFPDSAAEFCRGAGVRHEPACGCACRAKRLRLHAAEYFRSNARRHGVG